MKHINPLMTAGFTHLLVLGFLILPLVGQADPVSRKKRAFRVIIPASETIGVLGVRSAPSENTALAPRLEQGAVAPRVDPAPEVPSSQPSEPVVSLSTDFSAGNRYPGTIDLRIPPPPIPEDNLVVMADNPGGVPPRIELETADPVVAEPRSQPVNEGQLLAASASATRVEETPDNVSAANPYYSNLSESAPQPSVTKPSTSNRSSSTKTASSSRSSGSSTFFNSRNSRFRSSSKRSSSSCRGGV